MDLRKDTFKEHKDNGLYTLLSAGLCDKCNKVKPYNTGGNNIDEPEYIEAMCIAKMIVIEPLPPDEQMTECEFFKPCT